MKAIGIIAEYNPFHNGHLYHLEKVKAMYPDYTIIVVMNGNFTERGEVTIIDKWKRSDIALELGVDLVIELPFPFSTQSADYYAYVIKAYMTKIPSNQQVGISKGHIYNKSDAAPVGLWSEDKDTKEWTRTATYKAFCDALSGK